MRKPHWQIALLTLSIAWLLTGNTCKTIRETQIVSFEINPNPITRGGSVTIAWQAEFVGLRDGGPYCTLQRTFEGQPADDLDVVDCLDTRTDQIDATASATYVNYRFSALRRSGQSYETKDIRLDIHHANITIAPATITLEPNTSHDFTATITGITDTTITWNATCGTINANGTTITYTAPASIPNPPTCQVTATSVTDPMASASATVTIEAPPQAHLDLQPTDITLAPLASHDFTATITGVTDTTVTWDATCGTIHGSGTTITYTAPSSVPDPPTCHVTATSQADPDVSASATVTIARDAGAVIWTRQFGTSDEDTATSVAADASGNIIVAGYTYGALEGANVGCSDAFVRKLDSDGTVLWTRQFGTESVSWMGSGDFATGVAVDGLENVVVVGYTWGALDGPNAGESDAFVRKYDPAGNVLWARQFGTSDYDRASDVAVDGSGNVLVVGHTWDALEGPNAGSADAFVRKYDPAGNVLWTRQFGTSALDYASGVAVDGSGNVVVSGTTDGSLEGFSAGNSDAFVRKYDADGNVLWTRQFGTSEYDRARGVAVDGSGNVLVAGYTGGSLEGTNAGDADAFARKYDSDGDLVWTRQYGTSELDIAVDVAVDGSANVLVVGFTRGALEGPNAGAADAFVRKHAPDGDLVWARQFGTSSNEEANGVVVDSSGNVLVVGYTGGSLGGTQASYRDAFVRKFAP